jgi:hypothetical protein
MIGLLPILARWRFGLSIAAAVAVFGLIVASWHYRHAYHAEKALRKADRAAYAAAQSEATNEADKSYRAELADARSAADRYIAGHRVRSTFASSAGRAPSSAEGDRAGSPDRAGTAPDMVAVTAGDIQVCTINTTRLEAAREWALGLKISP